jgi:hypothetical protein
MMGHDGSWRAARNMTTSIPALRFELHELSRAVADVDVYVSLLHESRDEDGGSTGRREAVRERTGEPAVPVAETRGSGKYDLASGLSCRLA